MSFMPLYLRKQAERRLQAGHTWIYSNEVDTTKTPLHHFTAGAIVTVYSYTGIPLGNAYLNPHTLICARLFTRQPDQDLNEALLMQRLQQALSLRNRLFNQPFYRWVYGESDDMAGVIIDRFGEVVAIQITTAGMEQVRPALLHAVQQVLQPQAIVLRNDVAARELEGLTRAVEIVSGTLPNPLILQENQVKFHVPLLEGQKTGWFYDHRATRARLAAYVAGKSVLDVFSYCGAWGIQAACAGAAQVTCVDSSATALAQVQANADLNGVSDKVKTIQGDAFEVLKQLRKDGQHYDVIILDPPAFIKRKKDQEQGEIAYRRLNQIAIYLLNAEGILISASCSMHLARDTLVDLIRAAGVQAQRFIQILEHGYQASDHPIHPAIAETGYLKSVICRVI